MMKGIVISIKGNTVAVRTEDGVYRCSLRGKLKRERLASVKLAAVGDRVEITPGAAGEGVIESVDPPRTKLSRHDVHNMHKEQVIVTNVDVLISVQAIAQPLLDLYVLDRSLVMGESSGVECAICLNKLDLGTGEREEVEALYRRMGYPVFSTCARDGRGVEPLKEFLQGRVAAFFGPTGVGKSSLIQAMYPQFTLKVGEVSAKWNKGRHTTTWAELYEVAPKTFIADTPGLETFTLWGVRPETVGECFRDIARFAAGCRFKNCSHTKESECGVRRALERGDLGPSRYDHYLRLHKELRER